MTANEADTQLFITACDVAAPASVLFDAPERQLFFPPGVARIGERFATTALIGKRVAAQTNYFVDQRVVLAQPRQLDQQLLGCGSFVRIAEVHNDQAGALDPLGPLKDRPVVYWRGRRRGGDLGDSLHIL